jgi:hypothetical protein
MRLIPSEPLHHLARFAARYPVPEWSACITEEDVPAIVRTFEAWWQGAKAYAPHLEDRARTALAVTGEPAHVVHLVSLVADAYRYHLEERPEPQAAPQPDQPAEAQP